MGCEGEVVKERTRLSQQRRQVGQIAPGRQVVQEAVQGLLVGRRGRAVEGTLEERTDSLAHQRVVGRSVRLPSWVSLRQ